MLHRTSILICVMSVTCFILGVVSLSLGQDKQWAIRIYNLAYEDYQKNDFLSAAYKFKRANDGYPYEDSFFLIGHCYDLSKSYGEAIENYQIYLNVFPNGRFATIAHNRIIKINNPNKVKRRKSSGGSGKGDNINEVSSYYWVIEEEVEAAQKMSIPLASW